jgi:hypothetical protein
MKTRGSKDFEVTDGGFLVDNEANLEKLRSLMLDRSILDPNDLGPGDPGDFDNGAWHVMCHLACGCAVFRRAGGTFLWVEISHVPELDIYIPTVTVDAPNEAVKTFPLRSAEAAGLMDGAKLLGYVEGSSLGHTSARGVVDPPSRFNKWLRQDFDQEVGSKEDGGRVWEHWCTVRDIRKGNVIGTSVLKAYLSLVALCGGAFVALVARGRTEYSHPRQLQALVKAGFIAKADALLDIAPKEIPAKAEKVLYKSDPASSISAVKGLPWSDSGLSYYMFARRIGKWNTTEKVKRDLASL